MVKKFDLIVIGTGTAGSTVAYTSRRAGWNVAIIDSRPFGGTCALRGCDPKKVLVGLAELVDWKRRMEGKGIRGNEIRIDWPSLMQFKKKFTEPVPQNREEGFKTAGIKAFHGTARFIDKNTLEVNKEILSAKYIIIAAGAKPMKLNIPGAEYLTISDEFLELGELPKRIVFVGGGYISFEFAHIARRAGAEVQILHQGSRPLEGFDPDLVGKLFDGTKELGIDIQLDTSVEAIEKTAKEFLVHASGKGGQRTFEGDLVVHGAGRVPAVDDLALEKAGIERDKKGILVNEYLQSISNPSVYAAGDSSLTQGGPPLTPVAALEGGVVARNLLNGNSHTPNYAGIASVVFTIPALARVGWQEAELKAQGLKFKVRYEDTSWWYSSRRVNERHAGFKVLVEEGSERILGAHLLGPHAEEVINIFALAIRLGLTAPQLKEMPYAYPTSASDVSYMV